MLHHMLRAAAGNRLWTPERITTDLWLDADDSSTITIDTGVSAWADKSGNGRDATQATASSQPALSAASMNGLDTLSFDGSDDALSFVGFSQVSPAHVFAVVDTTNIQTGYRNLLERDTSGGAPYGPAFYLGGSGGGGNSYKPTIYWGTADQIIAANTYQTSYIAEFIIEPGAAGFRANGGIKETSATSATALTSWVSISKTSTQQPLFNLAEIVLCEYGISDVDREKMEGYLAHKWGLTTSLPASHPYKTEAP